MIHTVAIYASDCRGAIGYNNGLVVNSKADIEHFWESIGSDPIIVGSKTWEGAKKYFLKRRPNAVHIVLTREEKPSEDNVFFFNDHKKALYFAKDIAEEHNKEAVWICGGASVYEQYKDCVEYVFATIADAKKVPCDTFICEDMQLSSGNYHIVDIIPFRKFREGDDDVSLFILQKRGNKC